MIFGGAAYALVAHTALRARLDAIHGTHLRLAVARYSVGIRGRL